MSMPSHAETPKTLAVGRGDPSDARNSGGAKTSRASTADPGGLSRFRSFLRLPLGQQFSRLAYGAKRPFFALALPRPVLMASAPAALTLTPPDPWPGKAAQGNEILQGRFTFDGRSIDDPAPLWSPLGANRVWIAELQEFAWLRDLRALGGDAARQCARDLVVDWIERNGRWSPVAWDPVTTGHRLANWLGLYEFFAASAAVELRQLLLASATRQARHLNRILPAGLAGADLIFALKGLIYAGLCLPAGQAWRDRGLALLAQELPQQILADGVHVSRSPERHLAVLRDLIDLRATLLAAEIETPLDLQHAIETMTAALRLLQHGDGGLALFNDSNEGEDWQIDMVLQRGGGRKRPMMRATESGFERLQAGRCLLAGGCRRAARARDSTFPAHAGTLSFEMSVGKERLFVNCGAHAQQSDLACRAAQHRRSYNPDPGRNQLKPASARRRSGTAPGGGRVETRRGRRQHLAGDEPRRLPRQPRRPAPPAALPGGQRRGPARRGPHRSPAERRQGPRLRHPLPPAPGGPGQPFTGRQHGLPAHRDKGGGWRLRTAGADLSLEPSVYLGRAGEIRRSEQVVLTGTTNGPETVVKWVLQREGR